MVGLFSGRAALSGSHARHLERRLGIFYLRVRVPDDIRSLVGLTEVRRSLHTYQSSRARTLAAAFAARVFEVFAMARSGNLTKDDVRSYLGNCYRALAAEVEESTARRLTDWERSEQLYCSSDIMEVAREEREASAYSHQVKSIARRALAPTGLTLTGLAPERIADLLDGAARVLIEVERLRQFRLHDRLAKFYPADPIFKREVEPSGPLTEELGPSLGYAIDTYLATKRQSWTLKTHVIRTRYLGYLREHFGAGRPLAGISAADVRDFRDAIRKLRRNSGKAIRQSFVEKQTECSLHRVSDSTVALIFVPAQAFFRWCLAEQGYIERNPAENVRMPVAKKPKGTRSRRPFSGNELETLFRAPVFVGCQSVKRRFVAGGAVFRDAYFWIPVLGFYTGARLGELVQLHLADVLEKDGIAFLHVTEDGGGLAGGKDPKHVKSEAGVRKIPLHPDLISLGFLDFVEDRRKRRRGSKRLFPEVKFGADGQASTVFSKWFGRLMERAGLTDPSLVFHSFRHNAEDAFRDALQPQYIIDRVIGHSDGATSAGYGDGAALSTLYNAVCAMKLKGRLIEIFADVSLKPGEVG